jgi:hypothetical protein
VKLKLNMLLKDVDKGWTSILLGAEKLAKKGGPVVDVGISDGMGEDVLKYAMVHEFGSADGTIPQRSFVRSTIDKNAVKYKALVLAVATAAQGAMLAAAKSGNAGEAWAKAAATGLDKVGRMIVADIRARIASNIPPPLKEETIARKRSQGMPKPTIALIGRGVLIKSVAHQVRMNAKTKGGK